MSKIWLANFFTVRQDSQQFFSTASKITRGSYILLGQKVWGQGRSDRGTVSHIIKLQQCCKTKRCNFLVDCRIDTWCARLDYFFSKEFFLKIFDHLLELEKNYVSIWNFSSRINVRVVSVIATPGRPLRVFQNIFFKRISQKSLLFEPKIKSHFLPIPQLQYNWTRRYCMVV